MKDRRSRRRTAVCPTALVISRFCDQRPDLLSLQEFEQACLECSEWQHLKGPILFAPVKVSTRVFTLLHSTLRPFFSRFKRNRIVISLGLPYRHYLFGKTFPHFTLGATMRVLWTYDVWEPRWNEIERIVREARVSLLLLSSLQATEHFRSLGLVDCEVHWVPEVIDTANYRPPPWSARKVDVVAFGRGYTRYDDAIAERCRQRSINYVFQPGYPDQESFVRGLCDAKLSICFPRSVTHPELAGSVATLTLRYLQSMAAKCLVLGSSPPEAKQLFGYNPVIEVDWNDPVGQIEAILEKPEVYSPLVERNLAYIKAHQEPRNFVKMVDELIRARLVR